MRRKSSKTEFFALAAFLVGVTLVLSNGFSGNIFAQSEERIRVEQIEPIGDVLAEILENYVYEPDIDRAVEGALRGIMNSLDRNSGYIPPQGFKSMQEDTDGEFEGIGIRIKTDDHRNVVIASPIPGSPAAKAGLLSGDIIVEIDGVTAENMDLDEVARRIKGPRGQIVKLGISRRSESSRQTERLDFDVKRGKIPLESVVESRLLDGGIGYVRISDFKKHTARDVKDRVQGFKKEGLKALVIDLRWNPGGLLTVSRDLCELFLPKHTLVTYTRGRATENGYMDDMRLRTERSPIIPETMPIMLLVGKLSASSSEIVTGALQFHERALIIGEGTFGKGSVQTIIPLRNPRGSALRLTTALYYTPAEVTIDGRGILPDVEVVMSDEKQRALLDQMYTSYGDDLSLRDSQNHGTVTGNPRTETTIEDDVLKRAVEIIREDPVFENLLKKYHRDPRETQVAAISGEVRTVR